MFNFLSRFPPFNLLWLAAFFQLLPLFSSKSLNTFHCSKSMTLNSGGKGGSLFLKKDPSMILYLPSK